MDRRSRKREARRQEMLEMAMGIVEREGLEGLTIARLAEALDAAVGALYRYFPGKDALLFGMQQMALGELFETFEKMLAKMDERLAAEGLDGDRALVALLRLLLLMRAYLEDAEYAPARHRLIFEFMSAYEPALNEEDALKGEGVVLQILGLVRSSLQVLLGPGVSEEELWQATMVVWAHVQGFDHFRKRDRLVAEHLHSKVLLEISQKALFRGWGVSKERLDEAFGWFSSYAQEAREGLEQEP